MRRHQISIMMLFSLTLPVVTNDRQRAAPLTSFPATSRMALRRPESSPYKTNVLKTPSTLPPLFWDHASNIPK